MYSQNNEEEIIAKYFNEHPPRFKQFLDVGAFDGIRYSNTYRLVELGWHGVCIEPSSKVFPVLVKNLGHNPKIRLIQTAVDTISGERLLHETDDAVSTFHPEWKQRWVKKGIKYSEVPRKVKTITMCMLFSMVGTNFSFINIDVERNNYDIFNTIDFSLLKDLQVLCIEHDGMDKEIEMRMFRYGFNKICKNPENIIVAK